MAERISPVVLLVVDDDEFQRKIIGKLLKSENYRLIFAANGAQALSVLRKTQPDIILMDVMMPDIDGIEVTRYIREVGQFSRIPVIMITGNSEEKIVIDCMEAGATDFVVKPLERDTLIAKITSALRASARPESHANTTGSAGATGQQIPHAEQGQNIGSNINIDV